MLRRPRHSTEHSKRTKKTFKAHEVLKGDTEAANGLKIMGQVKYAKNDRF